MGFVASQHLDSVRDKFHLQDCSQIGEGILYMVKKLLGAPSKLLLKPAGISKSIEHFPNVLQLVKKKT
jgi:hypothetical protein